MQALEISRRAVKAGFEWPDTGGVLDKVEEEFAELRAEVEENAPAERIEAELGDLLFTLVNVARKVGVDPETALRRQLVRFTRRFRHIEAGAAAQERPLESLSLEEMEAFWQEAKAQEK
jgi:nucleoside triphosphate diphosphatase